MSWEQTARRWWKRYKNKRYQVSCRQLSKWAGHFVPGTKEGSYQTANAWWEQQKTKVDGTRPCHPHDDLLAVLDHRLQWLRRFGSDPELEELLVRYRHLVEKGDQPFETGSEDHRYLDNGIEARFFERGRTTLRKALRVEKTGMDRIGESFKTNPSEIADRSEHFFSEDFNKEMKLRAAVDPKNLIWRDRISRVQIPCESQTIKAYVARWLDIEKMRMQAGEISPGSFDNTTHCINAYRDWMGGDSSIEDIDANLWRNFFKHLMEEVARDRWSPDYAKKVLRTARRFIRSLVSEGLVQAPPNLDDRTYKFSKKIRSIESMTPELIKLIVDKASGQLKLHLLLMANCGFTQQDVSDLRPDEVDWKKGLIKRKRSKMRRNLTVPIVTYPLWPITFELLKKHNSGNRDHVLLTKSGGVWVYRVHDEETDKQKRADSIATNYEELQAKLKEEKIEAKSLKFFRKTSATLLDDHRYYGRFAVFFLGHAPSTVHRKHYSDPSDSMFRKAVHWLGKQYGFIT
jgi:integrase